MFRLRTRLRYDLQSSAICSSVTSVCSDAEDSNSMKSGANAFVRHVEFRHSSPDLDPSDGLVRKADAVEKMGRVTRQGFFSVSSCHSGAQSTHLSRGSIPLMSKRSWL